MNVQATAINKLLRDEEGASATEYAVLILLIILVALSAIALLGGEVRSAFLRFLELFNV